jgi:hypothetical protein
MVAFLERLPKAVLERAATEGEPDAGTRVLTIAASPVRRSSSCKKSKPIDGLILELNSLQRRMSDQSQNCVY